MKITVLATALAVLAITPALARDGSHSSSSATAISQSGASNSNINRDRRQAPGFGLGGLASDLCHGSWNAAVSAPIGGLGFGKTTGDDECRAAYLAQQLRSMGYRKQSIQLLVNEVPAVRRAFGFK